ncbi:MAG: hypothetical protein ACLT4D_12430 [Blautia faecis]
MDIIRESCLQHIKAVYGNQIFHSVDKGNISVCAEKSIADVLVFSQNPKDIFYKGRLSSVKGAYRVGVMASRFLWSVVCGMEQIVDVCIVQIKVERLISTSFTSSFTVISLMLLLHELSAQFQLILFFLHGGRFSAMVNPPSSVES